MCRKPTLQDVQLLQTHSTSSSSWDAGFWTREVFADASLYEAGESRFGALQHDHSCVVYTQPQHTWNFQICWLSAISSSAWSFSEFFWRKDREEGKKGRVRVVCWTKLCRRWWHLVTAMAFPKSAGFRSFQTSTAMVMALSLRKICRQTQSNWVPGMPCSAYQSLHF